MLFLFALGALGVAVVPVVWAAGGSGSGESKPAAAPGPAAAAGLYGAGPKYAEGCIAGNRKYLTRDFAGAIEAYRAAVQLAPKHPLAYYLMGEAQLAANNMAEADAAWKQAEANADSKDPTLRARVLFVIADLKERQKKWDEAKTAWQAYSEWAAKFPNAGVFPGSATARVQAIDAALKQDKDYEVVRQRIRDTQDGGVFSDPNAPSAVRP